MERILASRARPALSACIFPDIPIFLYAMCQFGTANIGVQLQEIYFQVQCRIPNKEVDGKAVRVPSVAPVQQRLERDQRKNQQQFPKTQQLYQLSTHCDS